MWACVSLVSVGTLRITGATPSITCTGERQLGFNAQAVLDLLVNIFSVNYSHVFASIK